MSRPTDIQILKAKDRTLKQIPAPCWIKKVVPGDEVKFIMVWFNQAYVDTYLIPNGVDPEDYRGHTDYRVWPVVVARGFVESDMNCLTTKGKDIYTETVTIAGETSRHKFIKFYHVDPDTGDEYISGVSVDLSKE